MRTQIQLFVKTTQPGLINPFGTGAVDNQQLYIYSQYDVKLHVFNEAGTYLQFDISNGNFYMGVVRSTGAIISETFYEDFGYVTENGNPVLKFPLNLNTDLVHGALADNQVSMTCAIWYTPLDESYRTLVANFGLTGIKPACVPPASITTVVEQTINSQEALFESSSSSSEEHSSSSSEGNSDSSASSQSSESSSTSSSSSSLDYDARTFEINEVGGGNYINNGTYTFAGLHNNTPYWQYSGEDTNYDKGYILYYHGATHTIGGSDFGPGWRIGTAILSDTDTNNAGDKGYKSYLSYDSQNPKPGSYTIRFTGLGASQSDSVYASVFDSATVSSSSSS